MLDTEDFGFLCGFTSCLRVGVVIVGIGFMWQGFKALRNHNLLCKEVLNENKRNNI